MIPILRIRDAKGKIHSIPAIKGEPGSVTSVNNVLPDAKGNVSLSIPSDTHIKELIDAKIVYGTQEVVDGAASSYPEGTLYIVI